MKAFKIVFLSICRNHSKEMHAKICMLRNVYLSVIFLETNYISIGIWLNKLHLSHGMTKMEYYCAIKIHAIDKFLLP